MPWMEMPPLAQSVSSIGWPMSSRGVHLARQRPSDNPQDDAADGTEDCENEQHKGKVVARGSNHPDPDEAKAKEHAAHDPDAEECPAMHASSAM